MTNPRTRFFSILRHSMGVVLIAVVTMTMLPSTAPAAPEPSPVATRWEFTFDNGPLRLVWIDTGKGARPYFYLTYKVTNFWGTDLLFAPDVQLTTDTGVIQDSGAGISSAVTQQILDMLDNPFMDSPINMLSTILQGLEHAREGVVIWEAQDLDVDEVVVYLGGLSGETEPYVVGRDTDDPHRYTLRKTMMLRYSTPGEFAKQGSRPFGQVEKRWVMR
ncbi:MAG: hypothetical protein JKY96_01690 [Phycisphaerales bacterium]|nr:hypothetical protein [Phycisphaerales bacterium]